MAGMATNRPTTVAISAPATPGAMAVRLAACAIAMPENVSITPQTVPSKPMNGPPATAVERMIMPFSSESDWALTARSSATRTDSNADELTFSDRARQHVGFRAVTHRRTAEGEALGLTSTITGLFFK